MRLTFTLAAMLLLHCVYAQEKSWSWQEKDVNSPQENVEINQSDQFQAASESVESNLQLNSTVAEQIVDEILSSTREGRALDGLDEVYSDPSLQDALQKGNDGEARNVIKDRLCYLGLMQVRFFFSSLKIKYIVIKKRLRMLYSSQHMLYLFSIFKVN